MARIVRAERRWWDVVAASPDFRLRFAVLRGGFRLVQALERTIMPLVQLPALGHGDPELIQHVERDPQRLDCPLEDRRERDVEGESTLEQQPAGFFRFRETAIG